MSSVLPSPSNTSQASTGTPTPLMKVVLILAALGTALLITGTVSLWMGWGTLIRSFYPRLNAWFIAIGITNFYFCDISVGLSTDLTGTTAGAILKNLVGFFYTPALVLLALSGYRWAGANYLKDP